MIWRYTCPVCKRKFYADKDIWAFKYGEKHEHRRLVCSWGCLRKLPEKRSYVKRGT